MANELDELMLRIADDPTIVIPEDIDKVIAYYRKKRAELASGKKPPRSTQKVSMDSIMNAIAIGSPDKPAAPALKRRI